MYLCSILLINVFVVLLLNSLVVSWLLYYYIVLCSILLINFFVVLLLNILVVSWLLYYYIVLCSILLIIVLVVLLPVRASEQGNVIGLVSMSPKKNCN